MAAATAAAAAVAALIVAGSAAASPARINESQPPSPPGGSASRPDPKDAMGALSTPLYELAGVLERRGAEAAEAFARSRLIDLDPGGGVGRPTLEVEVRATPGRAASAISALSALGGRLEGSIGDDVSASLPMSSLKALAAEGSVAAVRLPARWRADAVTSEGVAETHASVWHAAETSYTGRGVRVGIIDAGFAGYQAKVTSGELPAGIVPVATSAGLPGDPRDVEPHGTAVAEVVHDVAPGATLYLARIDSADDVATAVSRMAANGVSVINHSIGWFGDGPLDGTGRVNSIVDGAVAADIFWANSAGNGRLDHWKGHFRDVDGDPWLEYGKSENNVIYARRGEPIVAVMWWDDSWTNAMQDYDLYLYFWNGQGWTPVGASYDPQSGHWGQQPVEGIGGLAPATGRYSFRIRRYKAARAAVDFDLFCLTHPLKNTTYPSYYSYQRSISVPADNRSDGFMAVGAMGRFPTFARRYYSSEGPTRDGRTTPEITGPDGVRNSVYGRFPGTSASSPHVAGAAALVRQAHPGYTAAEVESYLGEAFGVDMGTPGPDDGYGWGRLVLPAPGLDAWFSAHSRDAVLGYGGITRASTPLTLDQAHLSDTGLSEPPVLELSFDGGRTWRVARTGTYRSAPRLYEAWTGNLGRNALARFRLPTQDAGARTLPETFSRSIPIKVRASLSRPVLPAVLGRHRAYRVSGVLRPWHGGKTPIELERLDVDGWHAAGTVWARHKGYRGAALYHGSVRFGTRGRYRARSRHWDASHDKTYSGWRYFVVR